MGSWDWKARWTVLVMALAGSAAWLLLVPWDLSEVDEDGIPIRPRSGDDFGTEMIIAALLAGVVSLLLVRLAPAHVITIGVTYVLTFAFWFSYRASVSRVVGANLWPLGLMMAVVPGTACVAFVTGAIGCLWARARSK